MIIDILEGIHIFYYVVLRAMPDAEITVKGMPDWKRIENSPDSVNIDIVVRRYGTQYHTRQYMLVDVIQALTSQEDKFRFWQQVGEQMVSQMAKGPRDSNPFFNSENIE